MRKLYLGHCLFARRVLALQPGHSWAVRELRTAQRHLAALR